MREVRGVPSVVCIAAISVQAMLVGCQEAPSTYEDCVLSVLERGSRNEKELALIAGACRSRFPQDEPSSLPDADLRRLELSVRRHRSGPPGLFNDLWVTEENLEAVVYNPTRWNLRRLRIEVRASGEEPSSGRVYSLTVEIPSETVRRFSFTVLPPRTTSEPSDPLDTFGPILEARVVSAAGHMGT